MTNLRYKTTKTGVPVLSDQQIEADVELLLSDYKAELLTNPQLLDVEHFAESYLNLNLHFDNLTHKGLIWGMMVFNNRRIPVYVPDLNRAEDCPVDAMTVVIDNTLLKKEEQMRSTVTHECAHFLYHRQIFEQDDNQLSLQSNENPENRMAIVVCRSVDITGQQTKRRLKSDHDWIEHHAKYFSAAALMPRPAMRLASEDLKSQLAGNRSQRDSDKEYMLMMYIASTFGVSPQSAKIRINQLNLGYSGQQKLMLPTPYNNPISNMPIAVHQ